MGPNQWSDQGFNYSSGPNQWSDQEIKYITGPNQWSYQGFKYQTGPNQWSGSERLIPNRSKSISRSRKLNTKQVRSQSLDPDLNVDCCHIFTTSVYSYHLEAKVLRSLLPNHECCFQNSRHWG